jgi:hypothetical protein
VERLNMKISNVHDGEAKLFLTIEGKRSKLRLIFGFFDILSSKKKRDEKASTCRQIPVNEANDECVCQVLSNYLVSAQNYANKMCGSAREKSSY